MTEAKTDHAAEIADLKEAVALQTARADKAEADFFAHINAQPGSKRAIEVLQAEIDTLKASRESAIAERDEALAKLAS